MAGERVVFLLSKVEVLPWFASLSKPVSIYSISKYPFSS